MLILTVLRCMINEGGRKGESDFVLCRLTPVMVNVFFLRPLPFFVISYWSICGDDGVSTYLYTQYGGVVMKK